MQHTIIHLFDFKQQDLSFNYALYKKKKRKQTHFNKIIQQIFDDRQKEEKKIKNKERHTY